MRKSTEGLTFTHIDITNFKNISKKVVDIGGGQSILVLGKNGSGKSSLIQALMSPLDTKVRPSKPIKAGEERRTISVTISGTMGGEPKEYILDLYFTPGDQKGRLVITNKDGETVKSPSTFIKSLIGNVSFDVTKWLGESKEKKLATLKMLTGCSDKIEGINVEIKELKEKKKMKAQRVDDLKAVLKNHGYKPDDIDKYMTPVPLQPIQEDMSAVSQVQQKYDSVVSKMKGFNDDIVKNTESSKRANEEILRLEALIREQKIIIENNSAATEKCYANIEIGNKWLNEHSRPSIEEVSARLNDAIVHNEHNAKIKVHAEQQKEMLAASKELETIADSIEKKEGERNKIISGSQLPIEGLTFDDAEIFLDGLPLEEGQINTARLFDVGVDIAMAMNPGLRTRFLHDGSLLDKEGLKTIVDKIENKGYQAIVEVVSESEDVDVKFKIRNHGRNRTSNMQYLSRDKTCGKNILQI